MPPPVCVVILQDITSALIYQKWFCALVVFLLSVGMCHAATVQGKIHAANHSDGIPDAKVFLRNTHFNTVTDSSGYFKIEHVPAGHYMLGVSYPGYQYYSEALTIEKDENVKVIILNIQLRPDSSMQTVTVQGIAGKETNASGWLREKNADNIVTVLSAETIDKSPDVTVANALQRAPGASLSPSQEGEPVCHPAGHEPTLQ